MNKISILTIFLSIYLNGMNFCDIGFDNGYEIRRLPLADTSQLQIIGLSNKKDIGNGMLFVWEAPRFVSFWMKDTIVPLSAGFFDENRTLFQIENMKPLSLESHYSSQKVIFVLELKEGDFEKHNITIGSRITKLQCDNN